MPTTEELTQSPNVRSVGVFTGYHSSLPCVEASTFSCPAYGRWDGWRIWIRKLGRTKTSKETRNGYHRESSEPARNEGRTSERIYPYQQAQARRRRAHPPAVGRWIHGRTPKEHRQHRYRS